MKNLKYKQISIPDILKRYTHSYYHLNKHNMHPSIKESLGYESDDNEKDILADWKKRTRELCKPCWELHYCPYGPVVEDFPLLPVDRESMCEHNEYLAKCLETGKLANGKKLDKKRRKWFTEQVNTFDPNDYPEKLPKIAVEASCRIFGHLCPAFFVSEPLTETKTLRSHSRSIPRDVMLKVVRRNGQICQECNIPVPDNEVEFDHIIPYSKGGRSIVENLRVVHKSCNRKKSASLKDLLSENPIEHLWELKNRD